MESNEKDFQCSECGFGCNTLDALGWHRFECQLKKFHQKELKRKSFWRGFWIGWTCVCTIIAICKVVGILI